MLRAALHGQNPHQGVAALHCWLVMQGHSAQLGRCCLSSALLSLWHLTQSG